MLFLRTYRLIFCGEFMGETFLMLYHPSSTGDGWGCTFKDCCNVLSGVEPRFLVNHCLVVESSVS